MIKRVLVVDPDQLSQAHCARLLEDCGCEVTASDSGPGALTLLGIVKFDVALVDFRLASISGSDLPSAAKRAQPAINIILTVEGIGSAPSAQPLRLHGYPLLTKP